MPELPVVLAERYSGSDTTYQKVLVWRVAGVWDLQKGKLGQIRVYSSDPDHTPLKLTIMQKVMFKELTPPTQLIIVLPPNELPRAEEVVVECKSSDPAVSIAVIATLTATEYTPKD